jgi:hypothetical protein
MKNCDMKILNSISFKKSILLGGVTIALMVIFSCSKDFLDVSPDDTINPDTFYQTEADAIAGAFSVYELLSSNDPYERYHMIGRNVWSDDAWGTSFTAGQYEPIGQGTHSPSFGMINQVWGFFYNMIRRSNVFLANVDNTEMDAGLRERLKSEVRFLRAFAYQELTFLYGDVPLITEVVSVEDAKNTTRTAKAEVINFVLSELEATAGVLPASYSGLDVGRATKGAADALRCRVLMFENNFTEAISAAQEVMAGPYNLETNFGDIFKLANENNEEVIFDIQYLTAGWDYLNAQQLYSLPPSLGGWTGSSPSQSLVDEFETSNGMDIEDPGSGYDPDNPFENRDPRLGQSIIFPGETIDGVTLDPWNTDGADRLGGGNSTTTGYWIKKFYDNTLPTAQDGTNYILIRYAEVLLNYAEAVNETSGPTTEVYNTLNSIRSRAGMPDLPVGLGQDEMRERILHERRIELAFEGDRFYTIRRRRIAEQVVPQDVLGAVNPASGTNVLANTGRLFDPAKDYLWPIPQEEIDLSEGVITQNPNW